jgi:hypothetical protein
LGRPRGRPTVALNTRLILEDEARRRHLEKLLNLKTSELVSQALRSLEQAVISRAEGERPAS